MTGRPIVAFLYSFVFFLFIVQSGNGQVTLSASKRNLGIEKAQSLFEAGQFELAKLEIEGLLKIPPINGILSDREVENLQYLQVVCGLSLE